MNELKFSNSKQAEAIFRNLSLGLEDIARDLIRSKTYGVTKSDRLSDLVELTTLLQQFKNCEFMQLKD